MTDTPDVLIDSNIIIDIDNQDEQWWEWSADKLASFSNPCINPVIYSQLSYNKQSPDEVDQLLKVLEISLIEFSRKALFNASQAFKQYRERGGSKLSTLPDFFIGGQALDLRIPLLTRDVSKYKSYFPTLPLISPESQPYV
jgi:predicted nucleic acid-binding protein